MQGLRSTSALMWAPEKAGVRQPLLILSPLMGTHDMKGDLSELWMHTRCPECWVHRY